MAKAKDPAADTTRVTRRKLTDYQPNAAYHNRGTARGAEAIQHSFALYGAGRSLVVDKHGVLIAGNQSAKGAAQTALTDVIEVETDGTALVVVKRTDLDLADGTKATELAYADNRASELSFDLDTARLTADLEAGVTLSAFWLPDELAALGIAPPPVEAAPAPDAAAAGAALQTKWQVAPGELWQIGEHRLICGDCRDAAVLARLMGDTRARGVVTSPPYAEQRKGEYGGVPAAAYVDWFEAVQANLRAALLPTGVLFVNLKGHCEDGERVLYGYELLLAMKRRWGWRFVDEYCWLNAGVPGKFTHRFKDGFEPVYHFAAGKIEVFHPDAVAHVSDAAIRGRGGMPGRGTGGKYLQGEQPRKGLALPSNVLDIHHDVQKGALHPASFPVRLPAFFMRAFSDAGDVWLDPFAGGGTTLVAAQETSRVGYGVELQPAFCAVILERFAAAGLDLRRVEGG